MLQSQLGNAGKLFEDLFLGECSPVQSPVKPADREEVDLLLRRDRYYLKEALPKEVLDCGNWRKIIKDKNILYYSKKYTFVP